MIELESKTVRWTQVVSLGILALIIYPVAIFVIGGWEGVVWLIGIQIAIAVFGLMAYMDGRDDADVVINNFHSNDTGAQRIVELQSYITFLVGELCDDHDLDCAIDGCPATPPRVPELFLRKADSLKFRKSDGVMSDGWAK